MALVNNCINCGGNIQYDYYHDEWQHNDGDPQCKNSLGAYLNTVAQPEKNR